MSTSNRVIAAEALGGAVLATAVVAISSPHDLWLTGASFHPGWIAVLLLAAFYGTEGLFLSIGMTLGLMAGATLLMGDSLAGLTARAHRGVDLFPLAVSILVAWTSMLHRNRMADVSQRLADAELRHHRDEETTAAMQESIDFLRGRHDRIEVSLSMWRELAGRLERGDGGEAARAALELCAIRSGATAGMVYSWDGTHLRAVASRGPAAPADPRHRDIYADRTASAAVTRHKATAASDVEGATLEDSDVAVPIVHEHTGAIMGVIALRGVTQGRLRAADIRDVAVVAEWLAPALARAVQLKRSNPVETTIGTL